MSGHTVFRRLVTASLSSKFNFVNPGLVLKINYIFIGTTMYVCNTCLLNEIPHTFQSVSFKKRSWIDLPNKPEAPVKKSFMVILCMFYKNFYSKLSNFQKF